MKQTNLFPLLLIVLASFLQLSARSALANSQSLIGEWRSGCFPYHSGGQLEVLRFNPEGKSTIARLIFSDPECNQIEYQVFEDIAYETGLRYKKEKTTQYNGNVLTAFVTPISNSTVDRFNQDLYCGMNDWKLNTERAVLGLKCHQELNGVQITESYHYYGAPAYSSFQILPTGALAFAFPPAKLASKRPKNANLAIYKPVIKYDNNVLSPKPDSKDFK